MNINVEFTGIAQLEGRLVKLNDKGVAAFKARTAEAALNVQREGRRYAPYKTGALRRSIMTRPLNGGMTWEVYTNLHYAALLELGIVKARAKAGQRTKVRQPFLRSAYEEELAPFVADIEKIIRDLGTLL